MQQIPSRGSAVYPQIYTGNSHAPFTHTGVGTSSNGGPSNFYPAAPNFNAETESNNFDPNYSYPAINDVPPPPSYHDATTGNHKTSLSNTFNLN